VVPRSGTRDVPPLRSFQAPTNTIKDTTEELRSIATQYAVSNKATQLHPTQSSNREASPNVVIQDAEEGVKGGKKRRKQCHQETTTTTDDDDGINKHVGNSIMVRTVVVALSGKH
jgi:hypothetical protein